MNKTAFRLFLCCTLIAALTALLLLCFNFFCFCILGSDYSFSLEKDTVHSLAGIEEALSHPGSQVPALPEGQWCILIAESGDVIWQENMPADIPSHYSINDVARFTRWFISDYPVYVRTTEHGLLVLGLPKNAVGKYDLSYSNRWFETLPLRLAGLAAVNLLLALGLAAVIGLGLYRKLQQLSLGIDQLSREEEVSLPETGLTAQTARAINRCSAALAQKNAALARRDEARQNWVNGISHDIRTPLAVIMGKAEAIQAGDVPAPCRQAAEVIMEQSQKVKRLVADLNLMSSLESETPPGRRRPVKVCPLIRAVVSEILNGSLPQGFTVELRLEEERSVILCDEALIHRALFNLISNAVVHNPGGCTIEIRQFERSGSVFIQVNDDGTGVPQAVLKGMNSMPKSAHGLGLPMVCRIVQAHGGQFLARNDHGFKAELCLPVKAAQ